MIEYYCVDLHSDYGWYLTAETVRRDKQNPIRNFIETMNVGGVSMLISQIAGDFFAMDRDFRLSHQVYSSFDVNLEIIDKNSENLFLIKEKQDLDRISSISKQIGILLSIEGASSIDHELTNLRNYYRLGLRSLAITHNYSNHFADGCIESKDGGLSKYGEKLIQEMNRLRILVDLSHVSKQIFFDVIALYKCPPLVSHSNAKSLCDHFRNLTDKQILKVGEKNGVIGITFVGNFLDINLNKVSLDRVVDHIDYIENLIGIDHIGLGADFINYFYEDLKKILLQNELSLDGLKFPESLLQANCFPNIFVKLEERGYSKTDIKKIALGNFLRPANQIL